MAFFQTTEFAFSRIPENKHKIKGESTDRFFYPTTVYENAYNLVLGQRWY